MYLKRLESVGFKSFAERISVDFVPGVTAVVGPNGSGKSNITDAIRWVLGEQSAKSLRGSKMEDIIFQGSDSRKPLNVAEVTLVLDNQSHSLPLDYDEVSVTRRVYRSGDSEFYINKQSCRLKDIIDLFMDSGLGRDAFSIISQGKVEEILSSKAEERRTIFEEAAGVLKYKQRKKKAEYKLAETQENLNRVEDIIHEIEQQKGPLGEQAEKAKNYTKLKEELKQEEISLLITEIEKLHNEWKTLLDIINEERNEEITIKTSIQQKESKIEKQRLHMDKLDSDIEKRQDELLQTSELLEKFDGKKQLFNERSKHFDENKQKLERLKEETAEIIRNLEHELLDEQKKLTNLLDSRKKTKQQIQELQEKLAISEESISEQIEGLKSDYIEILNNQAAIRNEKQSMKQQKQQISGKKDRQASRNKDLLRQREELTLEKEVVESKLIQQEKLWTKTKEEASGMKLKLEEEKNLYQESQKKLYQGYQYIEKLKSKKEMLEEMREDFQGFFHGVKAVLKARGQKKLENIHGAVIELIDVPKDFITAIETVLGGQAQHIVVQDDLAARNAIQWLKQTNNGRATFLPLESIQERFITNDVLSQVNKHPGFIGIAANLVQAEPLYHRAVNHLMGHVIISKTLKDANEIAKVIQRRFRVVTLDGDVVNPGGSMSGGALKKTNQSLFSRDKDIKELNEKINQFQQKITLFEQKMANQKEKVSNVETQFKNNEESLVQEQQSLQKLQSYCKELELKLDSLNSNLSIYDQDHKQYIEESERLEKRDKELTKKLHDIKHELEEIQKKMDRLSEEETQLRDSREVMQQELHQFQISLAELVERVRNQKEKVNSIETRLAESNNLLVSYKNDLNNLYEMAYIEETEEEIDQKLELNREKKEELTNLIQKRRLHRSQLTQIIQDEERELKEENKRHQAFVQMIQQKEVQANRIDVDLENRLTHLQTEYTITFEKASKLYEKVTDMEKSIALVTQIKTKIERLGMVNLGAIDEYDRISERYEFLTGQRNDLVEAKDTLYSVISEMDEEMIKRFDDTFSKIKEEFVVVFKQLFGGGHAELKLTDPKHLLDTGVEIIAQPPGKKLQNLGLLSGGERSLTAIALLFAILRARPVPFCILDEVEAALDEANVARFAKYIKLYSENTQFIVITHRKGTMEEADVLYGVSMQESGVSRLVSVRLEDTKELINT
ncbi:chromosome segregation protein SMC [Oceanobacillus sp. Castelsardo]|uniref:chromosome segregation protein SMC n=1 Tax=Oceanobacillus sp. Castelsardo TaxID=1851204 RepID=UPI00083996F9|nr:chromosome segregation protein SMC [Oceanobacillus sp. Castelsardo]